MNHSDIIMCELCKSAYQPRETTNGPRVLKEFKGYTIDIRLKQFRKVRPGHGYVEFIEFDSAKGQQLLQQMHEDFLKRLQEAFDNEEF